MTYDTEPMTVPDIDPGEEVGAAPVLPEDGKDPYPPDVAIDQDRPDAPGEF